MNVNNNIKTFFIAFLALSAIYLTGQLWFEKISNRNFFYTVLSFLSFEPSNNIEEEYTIVAPTRIITNFGNKTYNIIYNNISTSLQKKNGDEAIKLILSKGSFVKSDKIDWDYVLSNMSYIYDYSFSVPSEFLIGSFGQKNNSVSTKIKAFDSIVIIPARNIGEKLKLLFIDKTEDLYYEFLLEESNTDQITKTIINDIKTIQTNNDSLLYGSSHQKGFNMFTENTFIPEIEDFYAFPSLEPINPYAKNGDVLKNTITSKILDFFDNQTIEYQSKYTFSDENIVVKYYPEHVLEYSDYSIANNSLNINLLGKYYTALSFIKKDTTVINEFYLADYKVEDNIYTFYFDYAINDFPIMLPESLQSKIKMKHFIEISVENNKISKYKKYVYNFISEERANEVATVGFIENYNKILTEDIKTNALKIENLILAYNAIEEDNIQQNNILLYWLIIIDDMLIVKPTTKS